MKKNTRVILKNVHNVIKLVSFRAETFQGKAAVHLPLQELQQPGHCRLAITSDKMQTAMNAFAIFLYCNVEDILKLPAYYVLRSVRLSFAIFIIIIGQVIC